MVTSNNYYAFFVLCINIYICLLYIYSNVY